VRWRERTGLLLLTLAVLGGPLSAAAPPAVYKTADYLEASKKILCDCGCHPQSVYDCACGRAAQMRDDIAELVAAGQSGEAIIASYVEEFGEQILVTPKATGFNLVAWLGPALGLLGAGAGLVLVLRRWNRSQQRRNDADADAAAAGRNPADDPYVNRLQAEMREYDR
jgi:cytochrome c-type biogenesis protein CcmH